MWSKFTDRLLFDDANVKSITEDIINIENKCANFGSEVFISSILINRNIKFSY